MIRSFARSHTRARGCHTTAWLSQMAMLTTTHCHAAWPMVSAGIEIFLVQCLKLIAPLRAPIIIRLRAILANQFSTADSPSIRLVAASGITMMHDIKVRRALWRLPHITGAYTSVINRPFRSDTYVFQLCHCICYGYGEVTDAALLVDQAGADSILLCLGRQRTFGADSLSHDGWIPR
ncbi:hypothetical protein F4859DRAFT_115545 [Xylaria cf. heliscus]|nr:hypothetical protein F4859DRAFT_115545 [Xylaria cf. heliscus]